MTKSAFEREDPQLSYSAYLSVNSNAQYLKSAGPDEGRSWKTLPSVNLTYTVPVSDTFGYVLTGASANQFNLNQSAVPVYTYGQDGLDTYALEYRMTQNMNTTSRNSGGVKFDWRPADQHLVSFSYYGNTYDANSATRRIRYKASNSSTDHGLGYLKGDTTNGYVNNDGTFEDRKSLNNTFGTRYEFLNDNWEINAGVNYSSSKNDYRDMDKGFFRTTDARLANVRLDYADIDNDRGTVGTVTAYDTAGSTVDYTDMSNYQLYTVSSQPYTSKDVIKEARGSVAYNFHDLPFRPRLELGSAINKMTRAIDYDERKWDFVGADGVAKSADDVLTSYADSNFSGSSLGFGYPGFDYASPWLLHDLYLEHPEYFNETDSYKYDRVKNQAVRSARLEETITAYYGQLEGWFFDRRLRLLAGARYEKTEDSGKGYQQNANSTISAMPKNEARAALEFEKFGANFGRDYDGIYPSAHATWEIVPDTLQLRVAYAKTIGRPAIHNIVPYMWVGPNTAAGATVPGWVVASNPGLEPWEANNYDVSLEYYTPSNGSVTASVFQKDITNFFGNVTSIVDEALAAELGLGSETLGYEYQTKTNIGDAKIQGIEVGFNQPLGVVTSYLADFSAFANYTYLKLEGEKAADFKEFIPRTGNFGVKYANESFLMFAKWNFRGRQFRESVNSPKGGSEYIRSRLELDLNAEYRLTSYLSLFVAGRNVTNESYEWERYNNLVDEAYYTTSYSEYGAQYTFGVKGNF